MAKDDKPPRSSVFEQLRAQRAASIARQTDSESTKRVVTRVDTVNRRAGFLAWDPKKIAAQPVGDPGPRYPRLRPLTAGAARLFIAYSWARDDVHNVFESDLWVDAFAGFLFNRGYDIVFDRDPRNFDKGLNWFTILTRMNDCNYFVPIVDEAYVQRVSAPNGTGPVVAEWKHATKFFPQRLTFIGIWRSGEVLPAPLTKANTIDVRMTPGRDAAGGAPWATPIAAMFPETPPGKVGVPRAPTPVLLPDPPQWPAYEPY